MNIQEGLPLHTAPADRFRYGFESMETEMAHSNPVMIFEKNREESEWNEKLTNARKMYGIHMAMRLATEKERFDRPHRLFGLPSSRISVESATGEGTTIDYADFLNDPMVRPDIPKVQLHEVMEAKLGIMVFRTLVPGDEKLFHFLDRNMQIHSRRDIPGASRIVIKAGTSVTSTPDGYPSLPRIANIVEHAAQLARAGKEVVVVASGAVGIGKQVLGQRTPDNSEGNDKALGLKSYKSACAAAGQLGLTALYSSMFEQYGVTSSQLLLTSSDFSSPEKCGNVKDIMEQLLRHGIVPLLNENDALTAIHKEPASKTFSDNDSLAALVAGYLKAELLILLTDVDGLYDRPPSHPGARIISTFHATAGFEIGEKSSQGRGGMAAKIEAAVKATESGVQAVVIASGRKSETITKILNGENEGTLFLGNYEATECDEVVVVGEEEDVVATADDVAARTIAMGAREGSRALVRVGTRVREQILFAIAQAIDDKREDIMAANQLDVDFGEKNGLSAQLLNRLLLTESKLNALVDGIRSIANQEEPVGKMLAKTELADGLVLDKMTTPIGVLLIIFESRPDCLPQIVACAIRSGNGLVLKGGKEAEHSNKLMHAIVTEAITAASDGEVPSSLVGLVTSRADIPPLLALDGVIDLVIPRGSGKLVRSIKENTKIPVMGHADGICHIYVDASASPEKATRICVDAKTDYPSACNACETILFHVEAVERGVARAVVEALRAAGVEILGGDRAIQQGLTDCPVENFRTEYGELFVAIEVVDSVEHAIAHIHSYGSGHTDCIVAEDTQVAERFLAEVDSACVFHNASNRFADGFRFGLGAEVGISTSRLSPRGPVGVEGLLSFKWVLRSDAKAIGGHTVSAFGAAMPESERMAYTFRSLQQKQEGTASVSSE